MILECSVPRYARERLSMERIKFLIYRNDRQISASQNYNAVARTGNYTCKAVAEIRQSTIVKESQALVVKPKSKSQTITHYSAVTFVQMYMV